MPPPRIPSLRGAAGTAARRSALSSLSTLTSSAISWNSKAISHEFPRTCTEQPSKRLSPEKGGTAKCHEDAFHALFRVGSLNCFQWSFHGSRLQRRLEFCCVELSIHSSRLLRNKLREGFGWDTGILFIAVRPQVLRYSFFLGKQCSAQIYSYR